MTKERDFQVLFKHWLESKEDSMSSSVFELKICHTDALNFNAVKEHQINALLEAQQGFYHKISDSSFGLKPFDCLWIQAPGAWIVILFYKPRERKKMAIIPIERFIREKEKSDRKSLTYERASEIADVFINI